MLKIDVFPHILPRPFFDRLMQIAPSGGLMVKRVQNIPVMIDIDRRFEVMDRHEGYRQVLTLSAPPLENVAGPELSADLAKLANDEMAKLVERYPERFPGFVASLPMNNPDAAMREIDRAIGLLGATGVQIFTNVNGRPLDLPEYQPIFSRMAERRLPIWLHPARRSRGYLRARPVAQAPHRLLPHVLRGHRALRGLARDGVRSGVLRRRPRPVRHRLPVRSREGTRVHPRNRRGDGADAGQP